MMESDITELESFLDYLDHLQDPNSIENNMEYYASALGELCTRIENYPAEHVILTVSRRGYLNAVRRELQRRADERRGLYAALNTGLQAKHIDAAVKSLAEKKRAAQVMQQGWNECSVEEFGSFPVSSKYSDLFWECGTAKYDPNGARPLSRELAALTAPALEPDPVGDIDRMVAGYRDGVRSRA